MLHIQKRNGLDATPMANNKINHRLIKCIHSSIRRVLSSSASYFVVCCFQHKIFNTSEFLWESQKKERCETRILRSISEILREIKSAKRASGVHRSRWAFSSPGGAHIMIRCKSSPHSSQYIRLHVGLPNCMPDRAMCVRLAWHICDIYQNMLLQRQPAIF